MKIDINNKKDAISFDLRIPKNNGIVIIFLVSYSKSFISNGIVMAKTKKNRATKCKISLTEIKILFSRINNNIVVVDQTKAMTTILIKGILRKVKGYKKQRIPNNIITS